MRVMGAVILVLSLLLVISAGFAGEPGDFDRGLQEAPQTVRIATPPMQPRDDVLLPPDKTFGEEPLSQEKPAIVREYHYYHDAPAKEEKGFFSVLADGVFGLARGLLTKGTNIGVEGLQTTERVGVEGLNYGGYVAGQLTTLEE